MTSIFSRSFSSLSHLLFPPLCLHCKKRREEGMSLFCQPCFELLAILNPQGRCRGCFEEFGYTNNQICQACRKIASPFTSAAAVFEYEGPAKTWVHALKYGQKPYLAKGAGAFLVAQFLQLNWPLPDALVPVPISWSRWWQRGYNQTELLARIIGKELNRPVIKALKRSQGHLRQAGLSYWQRKQLPQESFQWNPSISLDDKIVLLIDDVMTTGSTLKQCGNALMNGFPKKIYALTLCKTFVN